jgi:hypothetical protein
MGEADTSLHHERLVPRAPSGRPGIQARSLLPHGTVKHPDVREFLRNSAMYFGGDDATVAHVLDVNYRNLTSGDPHMQVKQGIALYEPLNHFTEHDVPRLAHGLLEARRHASPQLRDVYTSAIHHLGYRFDEHGNIHKVPGLVADFSAAMKNPAFRAHVAVEQYAAAHQPNVRHDRPAAARRKIESSPVGRAFGGASPRIDRSGVGGAGVVRSEMPRVGF